MNDQVDPDRDPILSCAMAWDLFQRLLVGINFRPESACRTESNISHVQELAKSADALLCECIESPRQS